jgi:hypothetical protein
MFGKIKAFCKALLISAELNFEKG